MIKFANPLFLLLLILIPLIIFWWIYLKKQGKKFIYFSSRRIIRNSDRSLKVKAVKILPYLKIISLVLIILALSRPQLVNYYEIEKKKGIDILIALDISESMLSIDFKPKNRLEVAKEVIGNFIKKRTSDRLGLVVFAGASYTKCPLTIDYDILRFFLKETKVGEIEGGTAIGMALAGAVNRIRHSKSKTKLIILLTDGNNNRGEIPPLDAAGIARDFKIKVYTIGVGKKGRAMFPVVDSYGTKKMVPMEVNIDEDLLQKMANVTGGMYFRATDRDSLRQIFSEIDKWEKTEISKRKFTNKKDVYEYLLWAALILLLLVEVARRSFLRVLP
jgi:Ca-activated chloride channel family protein